jgi:transcriptional regulator GlxA family with amidase domain
MSRELEMIHESLGTQITVAYVDRQLKVSRRLLEMKARKTIGRTLCEEIQRVRLNRARALLRNTKLTVSEVAAACGFYDPSHLGLWFRRVFRQTPTAFRASFRKERG